MSSFFFLSTFWLTAELSSVDVAWKKTVAELLTPLYAGKTCWWRTINPVAGCARQVAAIRSAVSVWNCPCMKTWLLEAGGRYSWWTLKPDFTYIRPSNTVTCTRGDMQVVWTRHVWQKVIHCRSTCVKLFFPSSSPRCLNFPAEECLRKVSPQVRCPVPYPPPPSFLFFFFFFCLFGYLAPAFLCQSLTWAVVAWLLRLSLGCCKLSDTFAQIMQAKSLQCGFTAGLSWSNWTVDSFVCFVENLCNIRLHVRPETGRFVLLQYLVFAEVPWYFCNGDTVGHRKTEGMYPQAVGKLQFLTAKSGGKL